jgi:hypothetical protein
MEAVQSRALVSYAEAEFNPMCCQLSGRLRVSHSGSLAPIFVSGSIVLCNGQLQWFPVQR